MSPASDDRSKSRPKSTPKADPEPSKTSKPRLERPDEMSDEVMTFLSAIDEAKRRRMVQHLELEAVLEIVHGLGFHSPTAGRGKGELRKVEQALADYRREHDRLFPNWSEVWSVLRDLGYDRQLR